MKSDTKERILKSALDIFARDGYAGTNIKDIAEAVGIVKSAFYRHYDSKEAIWAAVFKSMSDYYDEHFGSADHISNIPKNTDELFDMTVKMVHFTIHDEYIVKMRKILLTEQFRDERMGKLATRYFVDDTKEIFKKVFGEMMKNGTIKKNNAEFLAFSYTAPITALIHLCDREPERISETIEKIESFAKEFINIYGIKNGK